ncbi:NAD(P)H:quinone oxidoreductase [Thermomonospora umbrina]|uniref:NAD(P)H dehydrogenase (Quinone) n=1 Tax=Thermomonospora umbrina TaxID=111806 RepID=A0A3D9SSW3_9ACTN|nr:NAD(P)H:quinone oxidoreductase [Thermomonospora umbrina]REE94791.1 NAD(P)H dehydrogenase (quinone) [Thermomonospora umbrina]
MSPKIAVIYYSSTGSVHALAGALAEGAEKAGAEVRVRRVAELAPESAIDANPAWRAHAGESADVPVADHDDLRWADGYAFGTPTRFGNVAAQLKQFLDSTGQLWLDGTFTSKPFTGFTSTINLHGGSEATLIALYLQAFHWGSVLVPPGYNDVSVPDAYGNPYGVSHPTKVGGARPDEKALSAARFQGRYLATITGQLLAGLQN